MAETQRFAASAQIKPERDTEEGRERMVKDALASVTAMAKKSGQVPDLASMEVTITETGEHRTMRFAINLDPEVVPQ